MPYNEQIAASIRELLAEHSNIEEKKMFQGLCFMVKEKLCICVNEHEILCRIGQEQASKELESGTCKQMIHNGKVMKDYVFVENIQITTRKDLEVWLTLCLNFNAQAKSSKATKR